MSVLKRLIFKQSLKKKVSIIPTVSEVEWDQLFIMNSKIPASIFCIPTHIAIILYTIGKFVCGNEK